MVSVFTLFQFLSEVPSLVLPDSVCECVFVCSFVYVRQQKRLARYLALKNVRFCELHFVSVFFFFFFCFSHAWLPYGCLFVCVSNFENNFDRFTSCLLRCCCCWLLCFVFWCLATSENFGFLPSVGKPSLCQREKSCPQNNLLLVFLAFVIFEFEVSSCQRNAEILRLLLN